MRKLQNIVSNFGNVIVRQGNVLVAIVESTRSLCARSQSRLVLSALYSYASGLASWLARDAWQGPITAGLKLQPVGKAKRRHTMIMCHRAAA